MQEKIWNQSFQNLTRECTADKTEGDICKFSLKFEILILRVYPKCSTMIFYPQWSSGAGNGGENSAKKH